MVLSFVYNACMLILNRKVDERITIGKEGVEVVVLKASKNKVKLGIIAPPDVIVQRNELLNRAESTPPNLEPPRRPSVLDASLSTPQP